VDHLPLGTGRLDVKKVLKVMEEKTPLVTLENKSVKWIRDSISYLRKLWD
jgi:sugar phosphate isomerase/epimerase